MDKSRKLKIFSSVGEVRLSAAQAIGLPLSWQAVICIAAYSKQAAVGLVADCGVLVAASRLHLARGTAALRLRQDGVFTGPGVWAYDLWGTQTVIRIYPATASVVGELVLADGAGDWVSTSSTVVDGTSADWVFTPVSSAEVPLPSVQRVEEMLDLCANVQRRLDEAEDLALALRERRRELVAVIADEGLIGVAAQRMGLTRGRLYQIRDQAAQDLQGVPS